MSVLVSLTYFIKNNIEVDLKFHIVLEYVLPHFKF